MWRNLFRDFCFGVLYHAKVFLYHLPRRGTDFRVCDAPHRFLLPIGISVVEFPHCPAGFAIYWHCTHFQYCVMLFGDGIDKRCRELGTNKPAVIPLPSRHWFSESCIYMTAVFRHHSLQCLGSCSISLLCVLVPGCCFHVTNARQLIEEKQEAS